MSVIKRDGRVEEFNVEKIVTAAKKAYQACNSELSKDVENELRSLFVSRDIVGIEEIQDAVEKVLMKDNPEFAKAFIIYRYKHQESRLARERIDYIYRYSNSSDNASTASETDANANVTMKNVANLEGEVYKLQNRVIQRQRMKDKLKELFPEVAKQYEKDLENHIIYKHDESGFAGAISPYCCSISMYPFLTSGIKDIGGLSAAPQNIDSYCGMYINLIFAVSAQFAGAVATSEFLLYFDYFARKEWGDNYWEKPEVIITSEHSKRQKTISGQIHQYFQQVM